MSAPACQAYIAPGETQSVLAIKDENTLSASSLTFEVNKWDPTAGGGSGAYVAVASWGLGSYSGQAGWSVERPVDNDYLEVTAPAGMDTTTPHRVRWWGANAVGSPYTDATNEPDLYEVILCSGCPDPGYTKELPQGQTREFSTDGSSPGPSVDVWEIWRCGELIDSGSGIGEEGLNGWNVADGVVLSYAITAPEDALVTYGYQARIERSDGTNRVVNFNVIEFVTSQGAGIMAERPAVFEGGRLGIENTAGTAVGPTSILQAKQIGVPQPIQPSVEVYQSGGLAAVDIINQKGHTEMPVGGAMNYIEMIWFLASLLKTPTIVTPAGAPATAKDIIFRVTQAGADDLFKTFTVEGGMTDFVGRVASVFVRSGSLSFGQQGNSFEGGMVGRLIDEAAAFTAGATDLSLVPLAPGDNNHYVASSVAGLSAGILSRVLNSTFTFGARRQPLFVQKSADTSFSAIIPVRNQEMLATLELQHDSTSIGYLTNLRNRDLLYYRFKNVGPLIETGFNYEFELTLPFKFQQPGRGERDNVTSGSYNLRPIYKADFEPTADGLGATGGFMEIRIRAPFAAFPAATDL